MVVLPENHKLADKEYFPIKELSNYPFMLLEKGSKNGNYGDIWKV